MNGGATTVYIDPDLQRAEDQRELIQLGKLRRLLDLPAYLFERYAGDKCKGECEAAIPIGDMGLTCCHFYTSALRYRELRAMEAILQKRLFPPPALDTQAHLREVICELAKSA